MGHRRLSIIDLSSAGKQPMCNEDESIWITYNGEIYNFKELRIELEQLGHKFKSDTDTEIIIHGYEEWGEEILQKLNGMFAFAIWDSTKKELFVARDRLGIKPLYYYWKGGKFIFASEVKTILEANIRRELNDNAIHHFLIFGFTPAETSGLKNIYKLKPSNYIKLKGSELKIQRYWSPDFSKKIKFSESTWIKLIRDHLDESVKKRLIADVPVGAFLSGGIDSSAVVASVSKVKDNLKTFSIGFEYDEFNEAPYAKIISERFGTQHYEQYFNAEDVRKLIPDLAYFYDDPLADYSALPTYFVSKIARKHVKVCLGGDGGDELFGGYNWYKHYLILEKQKFIPLLLRRNLVYPTFNLLSKKFNNHFFNKTKTLIETKKIKSYQRYAKIR